jgi:HK97 family phage major capsid protein
MTQEEIQAKIEEKAKALYDAGKANTLAEAKAQAQELFKGVEQIKTDLQNDFEAKLKVVKDEADKKARELEDAVTEINRFKAAAQENEKKGKHFCDVLDSEIENNTDEIKKFGRGEIKSVRMRLKAVGDMGLNSIASLNSANVQMAPGISNLPNRRLHMRDIMATGRMTTSDFHYLRETGGEGDVNNWAEVSGSNTTAKPQLDLDYVESTAPSQFIAGFLKISRKSLDDITALRASITQRLLEKYLIKEDQQILSGNGIGAQLSGLITNAASFVDTNETRPLDRVISAISQLEESEYYANGMLLKPNEYYALLKTAVPNDGEYTLPGLGTITFVNGVLYVAGVPVFKMNGMPASPRQFLVGDWQLGTQLLLREDPVVEFFDQDDKNVQTNQITVRVEGRVSLPIYYPDGFVKGNFYAGT